MSSLNTATVHFWKAVLLWKPVHISGCCHMFFFFFTRYATSWFANCQYTRRSKKKEKKKKHMLMFAPVQSISTIVQDIHPLRPLFVCLITLETLTTTISFSFNLSINRTQPCLFWFNREGRILYTAAHFHILAVVHACVCWVTSTSPTLCSHLSGSVPAPLVWKDLSLFSFEQNQIINF